MRKLPVNKLHAKHWMIVDNFAGGGGASTGIEWAVGRSPDVAINHDPEALAMHEANHPRTRHYATDVFEIDPQVVVRDRPVGLAWFSPDCTFHSKARGEKPIRDKDRKARSLAWVVVKWARKVRPRVILLENVEEFARWGPLIKKRDSNGNVLFDEDGKPLYIPCPARRGRTFKRWIRDIQRLGYAVEWRELRACDYGSPTIRKRLFLVARCDGEKIVWPEPTHGDPASTDVTSGRLKPWRTAAEIIDWSLPCHSIFLNRRQAKKLNIKRPLAKNTMSRIAAGVFRYVINNPKPFIVKVNYSGCKHFRGQEIDEPISTITGKHGDALVAPLFAVYHGESDGNVSRSIELNEPIRTVDTQNRFAMVQAFLAQHNGGMVGHAVKEPLSTISLKGSQQNVVTASFVKYAHQGGSESAVDAPLHTITASKGDQVHLVSPFLSHQYTSNTRGGNGDLNSPLKTVVAGGNHHLLTNAFLQKYYSTGGQKQGLEDPLHTVPTNDRFGLVTVQNVDFLMVDIGMRMLEPRELFLAQGFPESYAIDMPAPDKKGNLRTLPKDAQVRMCGNSVCPQIAEALVRANCPWLREKKPKPAEWQRELAGV